MCLPPHSCANFATCDKDNEKNDNHLICFIINNGKLNLNKLPSTRVPIATQNGWVEVLELLALFLLKLQTCDAENW